MFEKATNIMFGEHPFFDYCWVAFCDSCRDSSNSYGNSLEEIRRKCDKEGWTFKRGKVSEPSKLVCPNCK